MPARLLPREEAAFNALVGLRSQPEAARLLRGGATRTGAARIDGYRLRGTWTLVSGCVSELMFARWIIWSSSWSIRLDQP